MLVVLHLTLASNPKKSEYYPMMRNETRSLVCWAHDDDEYDDVDGWADRQHLDDDTCCWDLDRVGGGKEVD